MACHRADGAGVAALFPRLAGATSLHQDNAGSTVRVIINGARTVSLPATPTAPAMPSFGWALSDAQIADVVTYIRNSWGNAAPAIGASDVASVRAAVAIPGK